VEPLAGRQKRRKASTRAQSSGRRKRAKGAEPEDALLDAPDTRASKRWRRKQSRVGLRLRGVRVTRDQAAERAKDEAWAGRWRAKCEAQCPEAPAVMRRLVPRLAWVMGWSVMGGDEGVVRNWLQWARAEFSGVPLAKLEQAALCPMPDGSYRFDWRDACARQTLVLGLAMLMLGVPTRRGRRGTYQLCVRGIVRKVLRVLIAVAPDKVPSTPWLSNTWYRSEAKPLHECGLLRRLERVGFLDSRQLPAQAQGVEDFEVYKRRDGAPCTCNRYWLTWDEPLPHEDLALLHEMGWTLCEREIRRAPRTAAQRERAEALEARSRAPS
jgi:hypothetical protein